jgi:O-succinylbenzoate synthase
VGGLRNAIEIHDICRAASIPCWVGSMLESAVGASHCVALATLPGFSYPADMFTAGTLFHEDVATPATLLSGPGMVTPQPGPGTGVRPDPARLAARTISRATIAP